MRMRGSEKCRQTIVNGTKMFIGEISQPFIFVVGNVVRHVVIDLRFELRQLCANRLFHIGKLPIVGLDLMLIERQRQLIALIDHFPDIFN